MIILWAVTTTNRNLSFLTAASFSISSKTGFARTNVGTDIVNTISFGVTNCRRSATFVNVWGKTIVTETDLVFRFLHNKQKTDLLGFLETMCWQKHHDFSWRTCYMCFLFSYSLFTGFHSFDLMGIKVTFSYWLRYSPLIT